MLFVVGSRAEVRHSRYIVCICPFEHCECLRSYCVDLTATHCVVRMNSDINNRKRMLRVLDNSEYSYIAYALY